MKCMPQSQPGYLGSRFLGNLCAWQYWSFKLLTQTCSVPVWDYFTNPICVFFSSSHLPGVSVLPPAWAMADALTFLWFILDESWCIQHALSWKGRYPGVVAALKTVSFLCSWPKSFILPGWATCTQLCSEEDIRTKPTAETYTRRSIFSSVSTPLHVHKSLCTHRLFLLLWYSREEVIHREHYTRRSFGVCLAKCLIIYSELPIIFMENCIISVPVKCS